MSTGTRSPEGRGIAAATIAFVAMLMIGQTAPMEYVRDASMSAEAVSYDTVEFAYAENTESTIVIDLMSTVSNAADCKMYVSGIDDKDNTHGHTKSMESTTAPLEVRLNGDLPIATSGQIVADGIERTLWYTRFAQEPGLGSSRSAAFCQTS